MNTSVEWFVSKEVQPCLLGDRVCPLGKEPDENSSKLLNLYSLLQVIR